jgi:hypothetical protein
MGIAIDEIIEKEARILVNHVFFNAATTSILHQQQAPLVA